MPEEISPRLSNEVRAELHSLRGIMGRELAQDLGLDLKFPVHFKDPLVGEEMDGAGIDRDFCTPWEPGLRDGPTSARFEVQPVNGRTARWDARAGRFDVSADEAGTVVIDTPEYRQVRTWAVLQNTLDHVEGSFGMGRRVDWAFQGNRLRVHSEFKNGQNAYYNRARRQLEFYYYNDDAGKRLHTCLSTDIVNHELGHAILDGVRPLFLEHGVAEHLAFHESIGDVLALLLALRNNDFRNAVGRLTEGDQLAGDLASGVARQFGRTVSNKPHLRSGVSKLTMTDLPNLNHHDASQILTAAVFGFLIELAARHRTREGQVSVAEALWWALRRVQTTFLQALDLLPPVDPRFADLGTAMMRVTLIADPAESSGYAAILRDCFARRGITLGSAGQVRLRLTRADPDEIARSRGAAYRWLDDNRAVLGIPPQADLTLTGPFTADKRRPNGEALPLQISIPYTWSEDHEVNGICLPVPCGATLVVDMRGNALSWAQKPGSGTEAGAIRMAALAQEMALAPNGGAALCCAPVIEREG